MKSACTVLYTYCLLWPIRLYSIFLHYTKKSRFSGKKIIEKNTCLLIFCTLFVWNTSHSVKNSVSMVINVRRSSRKVNVIPVTVQGSLTLLNRFSNNNQYQISWKSVPWKPNCSMQTDRYDEASNCFSRFCESAYKGILRKISVHKINYKWSSFLIRTNKQTNKLHELTTAAAFRLINQQLHH